MLPWFNLRSVESSSGSSLDAWLKLHLAHLQLETEERSLAHRQEQEFQLQRELDIKNLEEDTAIRMFQLEL